MRNAAMLSGLQCDLRQEKNMLMEFREKKS